MLLFSRQLTLSGNPATSMAWAMEMTAYANAHSPLDVSLWGSNFGQPLGTVTWTSIVESQSQLAQGAAALNADQGYFDLIEKAADMVTTPGEDLLGDIIAGTPGEPAGVGAVAQITTATAIVDQMGPALGFAVDIAQHIENVVGSPVIVLTSVYGAMGGIVWIGVQPDMEAADASRAKLLADSSYLDRLTKTKDLFIPGSGHMSQSVRLA